MASVLELIARLGLNKTGFDAGLAAADKSVTKFSNDLTKKFAKAFGAGAAIAGIYKIATALQDVAKDAEAANKEFATIGEKLGPKEVGLIQRYVQHWDELGTKIKLAAVKLGEFVAHGHETGAAGLNYTSQAIGDIASFLNPFSDDRIDFAELKRRFITRQFRDRSSDINPMLFGGRETTGVPTVRQFELAQLNREAERHRSMQDRILEAEKEANRLNENTRIAGLTPQDRIKELEDERSKMGDFRKNQFGDWVLHQNGVPVGFSTRPEDQEIVAQTKLRLAQIDAEIQSLKARTQSNGMFSTRDGGLPGVFVGAGYGAAGDGRRAVEILQSIDRALRERGIKIRDVR